jgi:hypothetical protein
MALAPWPAELLAALEGEPDGGATLVLDPDGLLDLAGYFEDLHVLGDVAALRRCYEAHVRRRHGSQGRIVLHVTDPTLRNARDLPWDIEQRCRATPIRFPGERRWIPLYRAVDPERRARLAGLLERTRDPQPAEVLRAVYGVILPGSPAAEFDAIARLRLASDVPSEVWAIARPLVRGELAVALAAEPPALGIVQAAWADWLAKGPACEHADLLASAGPALVAMLTFGLLGPARRAAAGLPGWTIVGSSDADPAERIQTLLDAKPSPLTATTLDGWERVAAWWAALRAALADAPPSARGRAAAAWELWDAIDAEWVPWLQSNLGLLQTSSRQVPPTVDRVAPFLARRMRSGSKRICLVVMDGMGLAQWSVIRDHLGLSVAETHGVLAVVPTLTPYSRQAIFAGSLPTGFADSMSNNGRERDRWMNFWVGEGVAQSSIAYFSTAGAAARDVPDIRVADIVGIAVLAVDDLMHGANLLGDPQVASALRLWLDHGFLSTLITTATAAGFEVWLTADHGNVQANAIDYLPMEGLAVDRTGERVRLYATETLRDAARADGIAYQPPGLPASGPFPLFAPGRAAYVRGTNPVVVHGGLSLDEVLVPLARLAS